MLEAARKQAADAVTALTAPGLCMGIIYSTVGGFAAQAVTYYLDPPSKTPLPADRDKASEEEEEEFIRIQWIL